MLELAAAMKNYYHDPGRFEKIWNSLNEIERKIASLEIWSKGSLPNHYIDETVRPHYHSRHRGEVSMGRFVIYGSSPLAYFILFYAPEDSPLWLLFPAGEMLFKSEMIAAVGDWEPTYSEVETDIPLVARNARTKDFLNILRYFSSHKVPATKGGFVNSTWVAKLANHCGYSEVPDELSAVHLDMRKKPQDYFVTYPLIILSRIGGLLSIVDGFFAPLSKAASIASQPYEILAKQLFDSYLNTKMYNEIDVLDGLKYHRGHQPFLPRQRLAEKLKTCPPGLLISVKEFEQNLRLNIDYFAPRDYRHVYPVSGGRVGVCWYDYERRLLPILLTFFGALGLIDLAFGEIQSYDEPSYIALKAFRINPFGEYLLGMSDSCPSVSASESNAKGGFVVLPDFTALVPNGPERKRHETFFARFLTKSSFTAEAAIFKIDFESMVRLLVSETTLAEFRDYLSAADKPTPANVLRALDDWELQTDRIRLRQVTVLECKDEALLEEVVRYKGLGEFVQERLYPAVVVKDDSRAKIKKIIEKNKRFCHDVF
ncbi:MAG: helicase-associated domain-containing protein [Deltaproteobacteria bacterium]|nr:helicase-associated domain-containing protein [Deltaproteobacteria bacterium]